jgi:uncharacterized protein YbaP (TraB family)
MWRITRYWKQAILGLLLCIAFAPFARAGEQSLLWSVSRAGEHKGYLLGTIHSEDPRVLDFSPAFIGLLASSRVFAMELVPDLRTLARLAEFMHLPEGSSLADIVGEERFAAVTGALAGYGVSPGQVARMKPWAVMMTLSVPPPRTGLFMDFSLSLRASGSGLKVIGLETLEQQLAFLEDMPARQQMELLDHALAEFERVREVHDLMVETYLGGDLGELKRLAEEQLDTLDQGARAYFIEQGIDARNHRMVESLLPVLAEGGVFTAVGALHLPGEDGLLALLRHNGYELRPLASPVAVPHPVEATAGQ